HEMGHALVGHFLEHTDEIHKISIISRGQALGYTISLPREDRYLTTKSSLLSRMAMMLGGRAAEELVFHEVTTGAADDLERVTGRSRSRSRAPSRSLLRPSRRKRRRQSPRAARYVAAKSSSPWPSSTAVEKCS